MAKSHTEKEAALKAVQRVFVITLALNLLVAFAKLALGYWTNTLSIRADGYHSLLDGSSNIVGIVALKLSMQPADSDHPYGHRKFEAIASMIISFFIFLTCFEIVSHALPRLLSGPTGPPPEVSPLSYTVILAGLVINLFVTWYEGKRGRELNNDLLQTDAKHTLSDVWVTVSVLASMIAIQLGYGWLDAVISLGIAVMILRVGYEIIKAQLGSLVDEAVLDPKEVARIVMQIPEVRGCHKIRSRGMRDHVFMDLHIQVDPELTIKAAHEISYRVETALHEAFDHLSDVLVHVEEDKLQRTGQVNMPIEPASTSE